MPLWIGVVVVRVNYMVSLTCFQFKFLIRTRVGSLQKVIKIKIIPIVALLPLKPGFDWGFRTYRIVSWLLNVAQLPLVFNNTLFCFENWRAFRFTSQFVNLLWTRRTASSWLRVFKVLHALDIRATPTRTEVQHELITIKFQRKAQLLFGWRNANFIKLFLKTPKWLLLVVLT